MAVLKVRLHLSGTNINQPTRPDTLTFHVDLPWNTHMHVYNTMKYEVTNKAIPTRHMRLHPHSEASHPSSFVLRKTRSETLVRSSCSAVSQSSAGEHERLRTPWKAIHVKTSWTRVNAACTHGNPLRNSSIPQHQGRMQVNSVIMLYRLRSGQKSNALDLQPL